MSDYKALLLEDPNGEKDGDGMVESTMKSNKETEKVIVYVDVDLQGYEASLGENACETDEEFDTCHPCLDDLLRPLDSFDFPIWWDQDVIPTLRKSPVTHVMVAEEGGSWKEMTKVEFIKFYG